MEENYNRERVLVLLVEHKFSEVRSILSELNAADVAQLLSDVPVDLLPILFRLLPKELAADTFVEMDADQQKILIKAFSDLELKEVLDQLFLDDTVDIIEEMPANVVRRIIANCDAETRRGINEVLNYPKDSAGSIMTIEYVDLRETMTVDDAFKRIRRTAPDKETIYTCYVTDNNRTLIGLVTAKKLMLSDPDQTIGEIMETNVIYASTHDDKEDVAAQFSKYSLLALPVVDGEKRLVGIVTVDDAIDVIKEATEEDFAIMAAVSPSDESYFKTSVFKHARHRLPWLLVLMLSATITGAIITNYENAFAAVPALVAFIPMLMDTGGNCGSQSSTMVIRGMAVNEIKLHDFLKVWWSEIRIALLVSVGLVVVNTIRVAIQYHTFGQVWMLALVTDITLVAGVCIAKSLGCILPMLAKALKLDPAIMASPMLTTICDTCVVTLYFSIAVRVFTL